MYIGLFQGDRDSFFYVSTVVPWFFTLLFRCDAVIHHNINVMVYRPDYYRHSGINAYFIYLYVVYIYNQRPRLLRERTDLIWFFYGQLV